MPYLPYQDSRLTLFALPKSGIVVGQVGHGWVKPLQKEQIPHFTRFMPYMPYMPYQSPYDTSKTNLW